MGALTNRREWGKTAWKVQGERREAFGKIKMITLMCVGGKLSRVEAAELLREEVPEEHIVAYRETFKVDPLQI